MLLVAHAPCLCPAARAGGKEKRELERCLLLLCCSVRVQAEARQSYQSVPAARVSVNLSETEGAAGLGSVRFQDLRTKGVQSPLDAMSRRKLGSRPQHLSAIQGKLDERTDGTGSSRTGTSSGPGLGFVGPFDAHVLGSCL